MLSHSNMKILLFTVFVILYYVSPGISNNDLKTINNTSEKFLEQNIMIGSETGRKSITIGVLYEIRNDIDKSALIGFRTALFQSKLIDNLSIQFNSFSVHFCLYNVSRYSKKLLFQNILNDKCQSLIFLTHTKNCDQLIDFSQQKKIPLIFANFIEKNDAGAGEYIFRICMNALKHAQILAQFVHMNYSGKSVIILEQDEHWNFSGMLKEELLKYDIPAQSIFADELQTSFTELSSNILIIPEYDHNFLPALNQLSACSVIFCDIHALNYQKQYKEFLESNFVSKKNYNNICFMTYWDKELREKSDQNFIDLYFSYTDLYKAVKKYQISNDAALAYDATKILLTILNSTNENVTPLIIKDRFINLKKYNACQGVTGNIDFDFYGERNYTQMTFVRVTTQEMIPKRFEYTKMKNVELDI
ncbi:MAG: hypothetical protein OMM_13061, partial [Candidatus Magnetoglobus multicellularis str. Araruama]